MNLSGFSLVLEEREKVRRLLEEDEEDDDGSSLYRHSKGKRDQMPLKPNESYPKLESAEFQHKSVKIGPETGGHVLTPFFDTC